MGRHGGKAALVLKLRRVQAIACSILPKSVFEKSALGHLVPSSNIQRMALGKVLPLVNELDGLLREFRHVIITDRGDLRPG